MPVPVKYSFYKEFDTGRYIYIERYNRLMPLLLLLVGLFAFSIGARVCDLVEMEKEGQKVLARTPHDKGGLLLLSECTEVHFMEYWKNNRVSDRYRKMSTQTILKLFRRSLELAKTRNIKIKKLDFSRMRLNDEHMAYIVSHILEKPLTDKTAKKQRARIGFEYLEELHLNGNSITDIGISALIKIFDVNKALDLKYLSKVYLDGNAINVEGMRSLLDKYIAYCHFKSSRLVTNDFKVENTHLSVQSNPAFGVSGIAKDEIFQKYLVDLFRMKQLQDLGEVMIIPFYNVNIEIGKLSSSTIAAVSTTTVTRKGNSDGLLSHQDALALAMDEMRFLAEDRHAQIIQHNFTMDQVDGVSLSLMSRLTVPCYVSITSKENILSITRELMAMGFNSPSKLTYVNMVDLKTRLRVIDDIYLKYLVRCVCEYDQFFQSLSRAEQRSSTSRNKLPRSEWDQLMSLEDHDALTFIEGQSYTSSGSRLMNQLQTSGHADSLDTYEYDRRKRTYKTICESQYYRRGIQARNDVNERIKQRFYSEEL